MTKVTINYADQDVEVIAGADAWVSGVSTSRRLNGHLYNATRADQDEIRWSRYFSKSGTYRVKVVHVTASNSGIVRLGINDVNGTKNTTNILNDDDWYSSSGIKNVESFATVEVSRGFNYINHLTNGKNGSSSHYYTYYQFVEFTLINEHPVLGEATASPRNGMELLASADWSSGYLLNSGTFTAKKCLWVQGWYKNESNTGYARFRVGNSIIDGTNNYANRYSYNGEGDNYSGVSTDAIKMNVTNTDASGATGFFNMFIINNALNEKLVIGHHTLTASGSGSSPIRNEFVAKWVDLSVQIDVVELHRYGGNNFTEGGIKVWGMD
tara:strand:- start:16 stop:990 length:975 start_codon:yes stop_codon:yes gene_type:complete